MPPQAIGGVLGVAKAYATRVGEGPFVTELHDALGERLRETGHEYGASTGRPRRCGWYDAVAVRYAARVNGIGALALTKLDVLDGLDTLKICIGYKTPDGHPGFARFANEYYADIQPVYEELPGWQDSTLGAKRLEELPANARRYIERIEEAVGATIDIISTGPDRSETIVLRDPFEI